MQDVSGPAGYVVGVSADRKPQERQQRNLPTARAPSHSRGTLGARAPLPRLRCVDFLPKWHTGQERLKYSEIEAFTAHAHAESGFQSWRRDPCRAEDKLADSERARSETDANQQQPRHRATGGAHGTHGSLCRVRHRGGPRGGRSPQSPPLTRVHSGPASAARKGATACAVPDGEAQ